ncbi:hypothetical protein WJX77_005114 [Trebouxia sp. C0004]
MSQDKRRKSHARATRQARDNRQDGRQAEPARAPASQREARRVARRAQREHHTHIPTSGRRAEPQRAPGIRSGEKLRRWNSESAESMQTPKKPTANPRADETREGLKTHGDGRAPRKRPTARHHTGETGLAGSNGWQRRRGSKQRGHERAERGGRKQKKERHQQEDASNKDAGGQRLLPKDTKEIKESAAESGW